MTVTLKRQLDGFEKEQIIKQHGRKCFANGHEIPESEKVEFDHIRAFALNGASELNNIAPMCTRHNRQKGTLALFDFRAKLAIDEFFTRGDRLTLRDLLDYMESEGRIDEFASPISVRENGDSVCIESHKGSQDFQTYVSPVTGWKYFYATLPIHLLDSDDAQDHSIGLQPRYLIADKVFQLFRHFQRNTVLQPSLGRIVDGRIRLFDGQHKAAAILWNGHTDIECKIFLDPDVRQLNETNISAHDKFAQTRFYSSIMVGKLGAQFGKDFEEYKNNEDGIAKSEDGFMRYLRNKDNLTAAQVNNRFRSYLYSSVLEMPENNLAKLVSAGNRRTREKPLTTDMLSKSLFTNFLYRKPLATNLASDEYRRDSEMQNMVSLMNMFYDLALHNWDPKAPRHDSQQRRLERIFGSKPMIAWAGILKDVIDPTLGIVDSSERERPFLRVLTKDQDTQVKNLVNRLINWKRWDAPQGDEIDRISAANQNEVRDWYKEHGLTTGYLMGAPE